MAESRSDPELIGRNERLLTTWAANARGSLHRDLLPKLLDHVSDQTNADQNIEAAVLNLGEIFSPLVMRYYRKNMGSWGAMIRSVLKSGVIKDIFRVLDEEADKMATDLMNSGAIKKESEIEVKNIFKSAAEHFWMNFNKSG